MSSTPSIGTQRDSFVPAAETFGIGPSNPVDHTVAQHLSAVLRDRNGDISPGTLAVLADHVLGAGAFRRLDDQVRIVTSHMHLEFVRPVRPHTTDLLGTPTWDDVVDNGSFVGGVIAEANTPDGPVIARISGRFAILDSAHIAGAAVQPVVSDDQPTHHTSVRSGDPLEDLFQVTFGHQDEQRLEATVIASAALANERLGLHGGVGAAMGELVATRLMNTGRSRYRPVELRALFLRPLACAGQRYGVTARKVHEGRLTAAAHATLLRPDGKPAVEVDVAYTGVS